VIPVTVPPRTWEILQRLAREQHVQIEATQFGIGLVGTFEHIRNFANAILKHQKADPFLDEINWRRVDAKLPSEN